MTFFLTFLFISSICLTMGFIEWLGNIRPIGGLRRMLSARQHPDQVLADGRRWNELNERGMAAPGVLLFAVSLAFASLTLGVVGLLLGWKLS